MELNPDNNVVKLCIQGMHLEGEGKKAEASQVFQQAWSEASTDLEKFMAAHYVARHQETAADKLSWDKTALEYILKINDETTKANYPSLYLNIAKCYEDLDDFENAKKNYYLALYFTEYLPDEGYGMMIKSGIAKGLERISLLHQ
jgi:tetratricopeptide (TPR) repeat protein